MHLVLKAALAASAAVLLAGCGPTVPDELVGRWIMNLDENDAQVFVFSPGSVEFNFISYGSITSTWSDSVTGVLTTSNGVNIITTDGPNDYAWHLEGTSSLYLAWGIPLSQEESFSADWWTTEGDLYTKY